MMSYKENNKILYVDDEEELLKSFKSLMRKEKCTVVTLSNSAKIENILEENGPFAVVLSDQRMPNYDGVKVLELCKAKSAETIRVLVTGYADQKDTIRAVNIGGINSYISKPWEDENIKRNIREWITQYNLRSENKYLLKALDEENEKLNELLEGTVAQTVKVLGDIASHVAPKIASYSEKVKVIGNSFLQNLTEISFEERWEIMRSLDLFNLGITLLPVSVLANINKNGIDEIDKSVVAANHHLLAAGLLKNIPRFENIAKIIELQSKNYDGSGEPKNEIISGKEIPLGSRILKILNDLVKSSGSSSGVKDILLKMESQEYKYDVEVIQSIRQNLTNKPLASGEEHLPVTKLKPGMIVLKDIYTINGHQRLLKAGSILTDTFINILRQWHKRDPIAEPIKISN